MSRRTGKALEREVYSALRTALENGQLPIRPEDAQVYHQHAYFSADRGKNILVDVVIEIFLKQSANPFLLWIWECKDYKRPVGVEALEEFKSKLEQFGAVRTKGTLVTRSGFQRSAVNYARTHGIGLVRLIPTNQIEWVLPRTTSAPKAAFGWSPTIIKALSESDYVSLGAAAFTLTPNGETGNFSTLVDLAAAHIIDWGLATTPGNRTDTR